MDDKELCRTIEAQVAALFGDRATVLPVQIRPNFNTGNSLLFVGARANGEPLLRNGVVFGLELARADPAECARKAAATLLEWCAERGR